MNIKDIFSLIAIILGFLCMVPYFLDMFKGKTKPHAFSWFIWGLLMTIAFFAQIIGGAGLSAWIVGSGGFLCFFVAFYSYFINGFTYIKRFDIYCLIFAIFGIILWFFTSNPIYAVIIVTIVDALGFLPAMRKAYNKPYEETLSSYILIAIKHLIGVFTLENYLIITYLFPSYLVLGNLAFSILIIYRRFKV